MKLVLFVLLGILALNALVIAAVACILIIDHRRARRLERAHREEEAHAEAS
jgi:Flp pilus assembly protein TadB